MSRNKPAPPGLVLTALGSFTLLAISARDIFSNPSRDVAMQGLKPYYSMAMRFLNPFVEPFG
jgi:hypothetical protein